MIRFILNDEPIATDLPPGMVMLDFVRYKKNLTGTKIGCREGDCGACTVLVGELLNDELHYQSMTSCLLPLGNAHGKHIVTIEGLNLPGMLNPVQQAMADEGATQCGFCTPGFVVSLAGFCLQHGVPDNEKAIAAIDGNICRCTGYKSIERAAAKVTEVIKERSGESPVEFVTRRGILPAYFNGIKDKLVELLAAERMRLLPDLAAMQQRPHVLGGGTDLYVQQHDEMTYAAIHFLYDHPELTAIRREGNRCIIGSAVTVSDMLASPVINDIFPLFKQYARLVSSTPIRNMATLAGNFVNASPIGDFTIFFLALDAQLLLVRTANGVEQKRTVALRQFYKGYKQLDKHPDEHIEEISFAIPSANARFNFEKVSKRTHLDIASVNSAMLLEINGDTILSASLSAGGVGPVPMYLAKTSAFLTGKKINEETIGGAITLLQTEVSPISDARGSKEYKALLLGQLVRAHLMAAD